MSRVPAASASASVRAAPSTTSSTGSRTADRCSGSSVPHGPSGVGRQRATTPRSSHRRRYVEQDREREPGTVGDYRGVINSYLLPRFRSRDLASFTPAEIEGYRDGLKTMTRPDGTRRLSNRTIVRHLVVLHAIFKRAARVWGITVNPASGDLVDRPPVRYSGEFRTLASDEVRLAASSCRLLRRPH